MKTYYVRLIGFCDATLGVYKIDAENYTEAYKKAIKEYTDNIWDEEITEEQYKEYSEEYDIEEYDEEDLFEEEE